MPDPRGGIRWRNQRSGRRAASTTRRSTLLITS
jgi:hypothetical protein